MMKKSMWIMGIALAGLVGLAASGCKKAEAPPPIPKYYNVPVDMPKLRKTLQVPGLDVTNVLRNVNMRLRYGQIPEAMMALDKIKENPSVTDAQKQTIDEVLEQMKQVLTAQQAARAPH
jgi:hypothetical protein